MSTATHAIAPKQRVLNKEETLNSFNGWKDNLIFILSQNKDFSPFLAPDSSWLKASASDTRGLTDDPNSVAEAVRKTAVQKSQILNLLLGQIANYATCISRNQIVKNSTSLGEVWSRIREHYGFHSTGAHFLSLSNIKLQPGERYEDLYQRLYTFFDDNLLTSGSTIKHHDSTATSDEQMSVSVENVIVYLWLERIHVGLPALVQQRYGTELRNKTLSSLKSEISQALNSLLNELKQEDSRILRTYPSRSNSPSISNRNQSKKICCLCQAARRPNAETHFLSQCKFLPEPDKRRMLKFRKLELLEEDDNDEIPEETESFDTIDSPLFIDKPAPVVSRRVTTRRSPYINCFYLHIPARICLDTGAESSLISERYARYCSMNILPSKQGALQADVDTPLEIVGEVKNVKVTRGSHSFQFDALVTKNDIGDIIAGEPFLEANDVAIRPSKKQIIIKGRDIIPYNDEQL